MGRPFDIVIIDEAAQAVSIPFVFIQKRNQHNIIKLTFVHIFYQVEPAILVPLAHGCRQVFLVRLRPS